MGNFNSVMKKLAIKMKVGSFCFELFAPPMQKVGIYARAKRLVSANKTRRDYLESKKYRFGVKFEIP